MDKFKLNTNKEKLTDQEIEQQMNFDKFISGHAPVSGAGSKVLGSKKWFAKGAKLYTLIATAVVVVISTIIYSNQKTNTEKTATAAPFIIPPIAKLDIPHDAFEVITSRDTTIVCKNGSLIDVPANAFIDDNGNDVKGKVQIHYREFHDQIDILMSGIPMKYDSAGIHYQLESAGMFEITAYQNNEAVHLKPGKQLNISMISHTNNTEDYNIYYLDTVKKEWTYKSENIEKNKSCFPLFYLNPNKETTQNTSTEKEFATTIYKPVLPKKASVNTFNFSIDYKKDEFPELAAYNGLKFEPTKGNEKKCEKLSKKTWEDVLIEKSKTDFEQYIVTFSTEKESHSFTVMPVVDEKEYAATMKDFEKKQKQYEALLAEKKRIENERRDSLYVINAAYKGMAAKSNLNERFNNFIDNRFTETSKDLLAYRTFSIINMGIWNSDKPYDFFASNLNYPTLRGKYVASFQLNNNEQCHLKNVSLIRRDVNSIYNISYNRFDSFPYNKGSFDILIGFTYENELVFMRDEQLNNVKITGESVSFKLNKVPNGITSVEQFKSFLKL